MRVLKPIIILALLIYGISYYFTHVAFNSMMNKFAASQLPKGGEIALDSHFQFIPSTALYVHQLKYTENKKPVIAFKQFIGEVDFWRLLKDRVLAFKKIQVSDMSVKLPLLTVSEYIGVSLFKHQTSELIQTPAVAPGVLKDLEVNQLQLTLFTDKKTRHFDVTTLKLVALPSRRLTLCFSDDTQSRVFYRSVLHRFGVKASFDKRCLTLNLKDPYQA